jgi:transposase
MTERELERRAQRRLAVLRHVEEVSGNVAATSRYYGISRQYYYGWLRRYEADGLDGLKDRSSRPHHSPRLTQAEVIEKIVRLRKHYHFGPAKIAMYLASYHDLAISTSGVWRILKRLGMNRLPASQRYQRRALRWKRYEKQRPGHQLQVDVKFIEPLGQKGMRRKKYYQFTAIDDCTRLRVLRAYARCDQKTAIAVAANVLAQSGPTGDPESCCSCWRSRPNRCDRGGRTPAMSAQIDDWEEVMAIDGRGMFLTCKYAIEQMLTAGGGSIVCLSSISGVAGQA